MSPFSSICSIGSSLISESSDNSLLAEGSERAPWHCNYVPLPTGRRRWGTPPSALEGFHRMGLYDHYVELLHEHNLHLGSATRDFSQVLYYYLRRIDNIILGLEYHGKMSINGACKLCLMWLRYAVARMKSIVDRSHNPDSLVHHHHLGGPGAPLPPFEQVKQAVAKLARVRFGGWLYHIESFGYQPEEAKWRRQGIARQFLLFKDPRLAHAHLEWRMSYNAGDEVDDIYLCFLDDAGSVEDDVEYGIQLQAFKSGKLSDPADSSDTDSDDEKIFDDTPALVPGGDIDDVWNDTAPLVTNSSEDEEDPVVPNDSITSQSDENDGSDDDNMDDPESRSDSEDNTQNQDFGGSSDSNDEDSSGSSSDSDFDDDDEALDDIDLSNPRETVAELLREVIDSLDDALDRLPTENSPAHAHQPRSGLEEVVDLPNIQTEENPCSKINTASERPLSHKSDFEDKDAILDRSFMGWHILTSPSKDSDKRNANDRPMEFPSACENFGHETESSTGLSEEDSGTACLPEWYHDSAEHAGRWESGRQLGIRQRRWIEAHPQSADE